MRRLWIIALVLVAGCGQPLQVTPPVGIPTTLPTGTPAPTSHHPHPTAAGQPGQAATSSSAELAASPVQPAIPQTALPQTSEQRWRAQQDQRQVFEQRRPYSATEPVPLYWFDPATNQSLVVGTLVGPFTAQAAFVFRPSGTPALEVPYRINQDFGLTAISPALVQRMGSAGYTQQVEAYVLQSDTIQPQAQ